MPVKIRLSRKGRRKKPFYHIVAADYKAPRDGKFIEKLGTYNPLTKPATIDLDTERAYYWLKQGAQPTETARSILRFKGVLFRQHLDKGVLKGALTQEQADLKFNEWLVKKEAAVAERFEQSAKEKEDWLNKLAGVGYMPKKKEKAVSLDEALEDSAPKEAPAEAPAEEATAETPVKEAAPEVPAKEETAAATEEAPAAEEAAPKAPEAPKAEAKDEAEGDKKE